MILKGQTKSFDVLLVLVMTCSLGLSLMLMPRTKVWFSGGTKRTLNNILLFARTPEIVEEEAIDETSIVVCGGGPAGLLCSIMLAQKFPSEKIRVYDRLLPPPKPSDLDWNDVARFYLIGLGSRGQSALEKYGLLDEVKDHCVTVNGRRDWAPDAAEGNEQLFTNRKVQTIVLPRDKLVGVLHQHVMDKYPNNIELNYGYEIQPAQLAPDPVSEQKVLLRASRCSPVVSNVSASEEKTASEQQEEVLCDTLDSTLVSANLVVAADGTVRTIANEIQSLDEDYRSHLSPLRRLFAETPFQVKRYPDDNMRVYKTIPMRFPESWRKDINYSARSKEQRIIFDALPANDRGDYCAVLLLRESDSVLAKADSDPKELRMALDQYLPQFSGMIDDQTLQTVAKKPPSYLPAFRYVTPRLNQGNSTVIIGDCAHTVKPYFGLGANSALEDVKVFGETIESDEGSDELGSADLGRAVRTFSKSRALEAKKLVTVSRELDRPGFLGFLTFILPIILDAIFAKSFPSVFSPNVITMLQRDDLTFTQVARKKRLDRLGQIFLLFGGGYGLVQATKYLLLSASKALGRRVSTITAGVLAVSIGLALLKNLLPFLVPGLAPADVMVRTTKGSQTK